MADWLRPGQHVVAMGSDAEHKNEVEARAVAAVDRYVADSLAQTRRLGELHHAIAAGLDMGIVNAGQLAIYEDLPATLRDAVEELGTAEGFRGYGPEQGYDFLLDAIETRLAPEHVHGYLNLEASQGKAWSQRRLDLSPFARQRVELCLQTTESGPSLQDLTWPLAVWVKPRIRNS